MSKTIDCQSILYLTRHLVVTNGIIELNCSDCHFKIFDLQNRRKRENIVESKAVSPIQWADTNTDRSSELGWSSMRASPMDDIKSFDQRV